MGDYDGQYEGERSAPARYAGYDPKVIEQNRRAFAEEGGDDMPATPYEQAYLDVMREMDDLFALAEVFEKRLRPIMADDMPEETITQKDRSDPSSAQSGDSKVVQDLGRIASKIKSVRLALLVVNGRVQL